MGDLKREAKRTVKSIGKKLSQTFESMKEGSKQIGEFLGYERAGVTPKSDKTKAMLAAAVEPVIPMADEDELKRSRRRRYAAATRSGRASTILSGDDETLG